MASQFAGVAQLFEDVVKVSNAYDFLEFETAGSLLQETIDKDKKELIFLIGDPGVGKSFLFKYMIKELLYKKQIFYYDSPFFDKEELLERFIDRFSKEKFKSFTDKKNFATHLAKNHKHTIFIDEAQLMDEAQIEFLRTLSDTKAFQIIMAMHKDEGSKILNKKHIRSRKKHIIYLNAIDKSELAQYLNHVLLKNSFGQMQQLFTPAALNYIQKQTKGNLRAVKRMLQTLFELLDYEQKNGLLTKKKIDRRLLTMAAIDVGLIDA